MYLCLARTFLFFVNQEAKIERGCKEDTKKLKWKMREATSKQNWLLYCIALTLLPLSVRGGCSTGQYDCSGTCCTAGQVCAPPSTDVPTSTCINSSFWVCPSSLRTCFQSVPFSPDCAGTGETCCSAPLFGSCESGWSCDGNGHCTQPRNLAPIIGGAVGGAVGLALVVFLVYWFCIRKPAAPPEAAVVMTPPPQRGHPPQHINKQLDSFL